MTARSKRVLVGYDGSKSAVKALDAAAALVGYGSTLAVVTVGPLGAAFTESALGEARDHLLQLQVPATYLPRYGDPADELVDAAQVLGADVVVVGGRTQNGHLELGLGPVSGDVVQRAPCDVLVVK
jgi:nucleotide-binding universal stress UspA family protein